MENDGDFELNFTFLFSFPSQSVLLTEMWSRSRPRRPACANVSR